MPPSQGWRFTPLSRRGWCLEKAGALLKVLWFVRARAEFQILTSLTTGPKLSCLPRTRANELPNLGQVLSQRACFPETQFGSHHFPPLTLAVALLSWRSFLDGCGDRYPWTLRLLGGLAPRREGYVAEEAADGRVCPLALNGQEKPAVWVSRWCCRGLRPLGGL